ncbi:MAG: response regulator transcription factor [Bacteroidota bacterium]
MEKMRIVIADDHAMFRQGLRELLAYFPEITIVGEAANGEELLQLLSTRPADIVLVDIRMPIMNGSQAIDILHVRFPDLKIIVVSADANLFLLEEYRKKGAHGLIPKGCDIEMLIEAMKETKKHGDCLALSKSVIQRSALVFKNPFNLTEKEMQVLSLTSKGHANKYIADVLSVAESTVESHKTKIYAKTGLKTPGELIAYGINNSLDLL